jgi:hypothetical protein
MICGWTQVPPVPQVDDFLAKTNGKVSPPVALVCGLLTSGDGFLLLLGLLSLFVCRAPTAPFGCLPPQRGKKK